MMTKLEYLKILENGLKLRLGRAEVDEIMRDYAEYFVEGKKQGKSDFEIAHNLGDPKEVANQIVAESLGRQSGFEADSYQPSVGERVTGAAKTVAGTVGKASGFFAGALGKIMMVFLAMILIPVVLCVVAGLAIAVCGLFAGLFGMIIGCLAVILAALAIIAATSLCVGVLPLTGVVALAFVAAGFIFGGILGIALVSMAIHGLWKMLVSIFLWAKRQVVTKGGSRPMPEGWGNPQYQTPAAQPDRDDPVMWEEPKETPLAQEEDEHDENA